MMALRMATRQVAKSFERRSNSTIAGTVYYRCNYHNPERTALISPTENIKWTYGELWGQVMAVAGGLTKAGYGPGSVIATDLDRTTESLLLQLATAHNGMLLLTVNNEAELKGNSVHVDGNVAASATSFLKGTTVSELQKSGGKAGEGAVDRHAPHAYYSSDTPTGHRQVYLHGIGIAGLLDIKAGEQVCVAASLNGPFGMGGVLSAVVRSAIIYLPGAKPQEMGDSAVLVADKASFDGLSGKKNANLRAGLVKVEDYNGETGIPQVSGSTELGGIAIHELAVAGSHPLFDANLNTYYSSSFALAPISFITSTPLVGHGTKEVRQDAVSGKGLYAH